MKRGTTPPAPAGEAFREHAHHLAELLALQLSIRPRTAQQGVEVLLVPVARRDLGHDLLRQHVEGLLGYDQPIQLAAICAVDQRGTLDEIIAREWEQAALGRSVHRMARAAHALQEAGDGPRRAELAHQVDLADIDAKLERRRCDEGLELAALQAPLGIQPVLLGEAAMMRSQAVLAQAFGEMPRHALRQATRVHEHQCRAVGFNEPGQPVVDLIPHIGGHHGLEG